MSSARQFGLTVTGSSGKQELVLCPFHEDKRASAWWHPQKELFYCAVCGFGLNAQQLAFRLGLELDEIAGDENFLPDFDLMDDTPYLDLGHADYHTPYYQNRGINAASCLRYGARFKASKPAAAVLPITNLQGHIVGAQYRYLDPEESGTRYRTMGLVQPVWPMHLLYELNPFYPLLLVEGVFSAMRLYTCGVPNAFALMGAKANQEIVDTLRSFECIFLYDNDSAGRRACEKMRHLNPLHHSFVISPSPDDMSEEEIKNLTHRLEKRLAL